MSMTMPANQPEPGGDPPAMLRWTTGVAVGEAVDEAVERGRRVCTPAGRAAISGLRAKSATMPPSMSPGVRVGQVQVGQEVHGLTGVACGRVGTKMLTDSRSRRRSRSADC